MWKIVVPSVSDETTMELLQITYMWWLEVTSGWFLTSRELCQFPHTVFSKRFHSSLMVSSFFRFVTSDNLLNRFRGSLYIFRKLNKFLQFHLTIQFHFLFYYSSIFVDCSSFHFRGFCNCNFLILSSFLWYMNVIFRSKYTSV